MADKINVSTQTDPVIITSCRKRSNESNNDSDVIKKSFSNVVLKVLLPHLTVGAILGKKGEDIVTAQKTTGAAAKISKVGEFYPGTNDRICLVSGETMAVIDFCSFIIEKIISTYEQLPDMLHSNKKPQIKLLVSNAAAGVIIGKNGIYVQQIKEESGAFIQLSQKIVGSLISERCVVLGGSKDQLVKAILKIVKAISQDSSFNSLSILNYVANNSPSPNLYPTHPIWSNNLPVENYQENFSIVSMSKSPTISYPVNPNATFTNAYDQSTRSISNLNNREKIDRSIEVSESIIGHILGKGGAALTELKTQTLTDIKISKKGVYVPNTTNRTVTVSGKVANVDYAIKIINESVQNEERRRLSYENGRQNSLTFIKKM